jgi:hypothetical protein
MGVVYAACDPELDRNKIAIKQHCRACEATRVRGEQSEELLDRRVECLTQRLRELDALTGLFAEDSTVHRKSAGCARQVRHRPRGRAPEPAIAEKATDDRNLFVALRQLRRAVGTLERAVGILARSERDPTLIARARFGLAQALWAGK